MSRGSRVTCSIRTTPSPRVSASARRELVSGTPQRDVLPTSAEVVVVGAGIVGCATAAALQHAGLEVCVLDTLGPAAGSSSAGEGNLLVSDKLPGADLALARDSLARWHAIGGEIGDEIEYEQKGGLVVAKDDAALADLVTRAAAQEAGGARTTVLSRRELRVVEPGLSPDVAGGVFYDHDAQVQPMLAVAAFVRALRRTGGCLVGGVEVRAASRGRGGQITGLVTSEGPLAVGRAVVNATGAFAGEVAERLGGFVPVQPRRGHVLVTEPTKPLTAHKVYESGYVGSIHEDASGFSVSAVVEATKGGTMLLGSSREFVGFARTQSAPVRAAIAERALALFPGLSDLRLLRSYVGFRPATADRLPVLGEDVLVPGLFHATGHEGAGVGLAPVSAAIISALICRDAPPVSVDAFSPTRFSPPAR